MWPTPAGRAGPEAQQPFLVALSKFNGLTSGHQGLRRANGDVRRCVTFMLGDLDMQRWARVPAQTRSRGVCAVISAQTKPGLADQFETLLNDFVFTVQSEERGCASYVATRLLGSENHFAVHARFHGWHSFQRHAVTAHMKRALPRLSALLATPVSLEIFIET